MDDLDSQIIYLLKKNPRESNTYIALKLHVSEGTVRNRIKKLIDEKVLRFSVDELKKTSFEAIVLLRSEASVSTSSVSEVICNFPGVNRVYEVSGSSDLVITCTMESPLKFNDLIESIRKTKGVKSSESLIVLKVI